MIGKLKVFDFLTFGWSIVHRMIEYSDGTQARVGDSVTLNQGTHAGTVMHLLESAEDLGAWDLDEPGLMINTSYGGLVFYPSRSMTAGEIAFASRAVA